MLGAEVGLTKMRAKGSSEGMEVFEYHFCAKSR